MQAAVTSVGYSSVMNAELIAENGSACVPFGFNGRHAVQRHESRSSSCFLA